LAEPILAAYANDGSKGPPGANWDPDRQYGKYKNKPDKFSNAEPCENLYIGNLPEGFDQAKVDAAFGSFGTVIRSKFLPGPAGQLGAAMVQYGSLDEATRVVECFHDKRLNDDPNTAPLQVRYAYNGNKNKKGWQDGSWSSSVWCKK